ncbi:hypothetical protein Leryth_009342 [Lithospermum erythrorhizon]|nr:hypothetical protein Leryth_009342 [Lithospermum erythrorhizon]
MINFRSKRLSRTFSKLSNGRSNNSNNSKVCDNTKVNNGEIKWELRPGGMLVQKRDCGKNDGEAMITIKVSTVSQWHDIPIQSTSTFGELKMLLSIITNLKPNEQRLLFKGKEREDKEYLHMVGVRDKDKVLLLEDPAIREKKLLGLAKGHVMGSPYHTISV